jgi:NTP pyrophosphatase (non-canonical NTP hydrolase)
MIIHNSLVTDIDIWLDSMVSPAYKTQPLAQDWARVSKITEEAGEAIAELISATGQNPRKPIDKTAQRMLLAELADTAMTAIYAIQHFTKDVNKTADIMNAVQDKHRNRLPL